MRRVSLRTRDHAQSPVTSSAKTSQAFASPGRTNALVRTGCLRRTPTAGRRDHADLGVLFDRFVEIGHLGAVDVDVDELLDFAVLEHAVLERVAVFGGVVVERLGQRLAVDVDARGRAAAGQHGWHFDLGHTVVLATPS